MLTILFYLTKVQCLQLPTLWLQIQRLKNIWVNIDFSWKITWANFFLFQVLNILQSCSMAFDVVDENNVYTCVGHPLKSDISNMVEWMLNDSFSSAYDKVQKLKTLKGLSLQVCPVDCHYNYISQSCLNIFLTSFWTLTCLVYALVFKVITLVGSIKF